MAKKIFNPDPKPITLQPSGVVVPAKNYVVISNDALAGLQERYPALEVSNATEQEKVDYEARAQKEAKEKEKQQLELVKKQNQQERAKKKAEKLLQKQQLEEKVNVETLPTMPVEETQLGTNNIVAPRKKGRPRKVK